VTERATFMGFARADRAICSCRRHALRSMRGPRRRAPKLASEPQ
jgi:hypothetical protein